MDKVKRIEAEARLVLAALDRHRAQKELEFGAKILEPTWTMRELQAKVNAADNRIAVAAAELSQ
jgi:hypothetical protein